MNQIAQLEQLVTTFYRDMTVARDLSSSNPEDDLTIKAAIVGFAYHSSVSEWAYGHFEFVRERVDRTYGPGELAHYEQYAENIKYFFALGLGYLLGLYNTDALDDQSFRTVEIHLPGIIMQHLGFLTSKPA